MRASLRLCQFLPKTYRATLSPGSKTPFPRTFTCTPKSPFLHSCFFPDAAGNLLPHLSVESKEKNWWDPLCAPGAQLTDTSPSRARNRHTLSATSLPLRTLHPSSPPSPSPLSRWELQPAASPRAGRRSRERALPRSVQPAARIG